MSIITNVATLALVLAGSSATAQQSDLVAAGEKIFMDLCITCHQPNVADADRIAPPIFAAKNHYARITDRTAFVEAVSSFILSPNPQVSRMPGAVQRFGVMPDLDLTPEQARAAAEYVFATDFSVPDWYAAHYQAEHGEAPPAD